MIYIILNIQLNIIILNLQEDDYIMATLKTANGINKYFDDNSREDVINYILRIDKTIHNLYGSNMRDISNAATIMDNTAEKFSKASGVKLRHFIISFEPTEVTEPTVAYDIAKRIAAFFFGEYQTVFAVHEDKPHLHIHIVINSVSYTDGHRYYGKRQEFNAFKSYTKRVLADYGIYTLMYVSNK